MGQFVALDPDRLGIARGFSAFTRRVCHTDSPSFSNKLTAAVYLAFILGVPVLWGVAALGVGLWDCASTYRDLALPRLNV
jgi:hypothetical protein